MYVGSIDVHTQRLQRQWIAKYMPSLPLVASSSTGGEGRPCRRVMTMYGRLLRAQAAEALPPDKVESRLRYVLGR